VQISTLSCRTWRLIVTPSYVYANGAPPQQLANFSFQAFFLAAAESGARSSEAAAAAAQPSSACMRSGTVGSSAVEDGSSTAVDGGVGSVMKRDDEDE